MDHNRETKQSMRQGTKPTERNTSPADTRTDHI
jgi:hypothetical protein